MTKRLSTAPIKEITNKDSTGNPSQYSILNPPTWGKNLKKNGCVCVCVCVCVCITDYIYITDSLCRAETNTL